MLKNDHFLDHWLLFVADDMVENENETLRDRVSDLEKRVHDQNDEITCLRATLADALRRINSLESGKGQLAISITFFFNLYNPELEVYLNFPFFKYFFI